MAQTKRKRRTKHRGNAAGTIETRGRTGRPPSPAEKKKTTRDQAREKRLTTPPTWSSATKRAGIAAVLMFIFLMLTSRGSGGTRLAVSFLFAGGAFVLYAALGFYTDQYLYRRRMRKREEGK